MGCHIIFLIKGLSYYYLVNKVVNKGSNLIVLLTK